MSGFILLHRKLLDWEWYNHIPTKTLFIHCLLRANHSDTKWRGIDIKRGQFITSISNLSKETGLSEKQIRNCLKNLEKTGELGKVSSAVNTCISVINYDSFQSEGKPRASKGQGKGKPRATDNNDNNENNENKFNIKNIKSKGLDFSGFNNESIFQIWCDWLNFKYIQFKDEYKQLQSEQTALNKLKKLSKGSSEESKLIIEQSISNLWKGLFELKTTQQPQNPKQIDIIAELGLKPR